MMPRIITFSAFIIITIIDILINTAFIIQYLSVGIISNIKWYDQTNLVSMQTWDYNNSVTKQNKEKLLINV